MKKIIVATSNAGKLREIHSYLQEIDIELALKPDDLEIEETGISFQENARLKASEVAKSLNEWAIADDSGLMVDALGGAPGIYSARYGNSDQERITRLLTELGDNDNRKAQFVCVIAIARPDGIIAIEVEGICHGDIIHTPRGNHGFGYDPIFYVPEQQQTFAEMKPEVKHQLSHRGKAFALLLPQLRVISNE